MERNNAVPATAGGYIGKAYEYSPHKQLDAMQSTYGAKYNLGEYKKAMNVAFALFVLGLISLASCWNFLVWIGLPHVLCFGARTQNARDCAISMAHWLPR